LPRRQELDYLLDQLLKLGRLSTLEGAESIHLVRLSLDGWRRVEELAEHQRRSKQAFVAMWFDPSLSMVYSEGIQPALTATGFDGVRVDALEHNDKIDDRIISEIRRSGLLVADFTGHRAGVYFEAGFAMGLGIPVIWCCRSDCIDDVHFDTRQYNHIVWQDSADLRLRLTARIRATVSGATLADGDAGT
jgi:nucleoside 2-deoxyribosyltransferase